MRNSPLADLHECQTAADAEQYLDNNTTLGQVVSKIESRDDEAIELLGQIARPIPDCHVVGVTGPPGAGKSTLVDKLVDLYRDENLSVGVIAVDPRSDITGGAFLGDRVRLKRSSTDDEVYYRSLSTSGSLTGTLASSTVDVLSVLDAAGKDVVIIETVGAGQTDTEIASIADTVLLVLPPGGGDQIQLTKAGILEIGNIFIVNKADMAGANAFAAELRDHLTRKRSFELPHSDKESWKPPIIKTVAKDGTNVAALFDIINDHREFVGNDGDDGKRRSELVRSMLELQLEREIRDVLGNQIEEVGGLDELVREISSGEKNVYEATLNINFSDR